MSLEAATYIADLDQSNPTPTDLKSQGDDHLRLIKSVLKNTFPGSNKPFAFPGTVAKTGSYSAVAGDNGQTFTFDTSSGPATLTLPVLSITDKGWTILIQK